MEISAGEEEKEEKTTLVRTWINENRKRVGKFVWKIENVTSSKKVSSMEPFNENGTIDKTIRFKKLRKKIKPNGWDKDLEDWIKDNDNSDVL
jgi:DNA-directed RNA polymerase beta' subunit